MTSSQQKGFNHNYQDSNSNRQEQINIQSKSKLVTEFLNKYKLQRDAAIEELVRDLINQNQAKVGNQEEQVDQASFNLCKRVAEEMIDLINAKVSQNVLCIEELARIINCKDPHAKKAYLMNEYGDLQTTADQIKQKLINKPIKEGQISARQSRLSEYPQPRKTIEFQLKVTSKSLLSPLNYDEQLTEKQCEIYENFQFLLFYLSNLLYTLLPIFKETTRFYLASTGKYSDLEDPFKDGLRVDPIYRNMCMYTFKELQTVVFKKIAKGFRLTTEEMFVEAFKESEANFNLELQESGLALYKEVQKMRDYLNLQINEAQQEQAYLENDIQTKQENKYALDGLNFLRQVFALIFIYQIQKIYQLLLYSKHLDYVKNDHKIQKSASSFSQNPYLSVDEILIDNNSNHQHAQNNNFQIESSQQNQIQQLQTQPTTYFKDQDSIKQELLLKLRARRDELKKQIQEIIESE